MSVIHKECALADGYATALMVMGPEDALRWCEEHDVNAFLIVREAEGHFRNLASPAFEQFLAAANPASQERR